MMTAYMKKDEAGRTCSGEIRNSIQHFCFKILIEGDHFRCLGINGNTKIVLKKYGI
jgi:hypothetical protein